MKGFKLFSALTAGLALGLGAAQADKGDVFLAVMPVVAPFNSDEGMFGGGASISVGANEMTDFQLEVDYTVQPGYFDDDGVAETRYVLGSFFTPYFGDIRPRFGGSAGFTHVMAAGAGSEVLFNAGLNLQGLFDLSSDTRLFAEANPSVSIGDEGGFSTLFKVGVQFRLSK
jgi:hypothetical protein